SVVCLRARDGARSLPAGVQPFNPPGEYLLERYFLSRHNLRDDVVCESASASGEFQLLYLRAVNHLLGVSLVGATGRHCPATVFGCEIHGVNAGPFIFSQFHGGFVKINSATVGWSSDILPSPVPPT